ncbi:hydroxyacylglutathione hydrolase [Buchnera aphidicola]|uniref:Hydroxyacylglutathione hydrolase n=1 Tax=Buchnera aphidicola subsp. Melaphis rhois TaxID=118103 RepID=A0A4D6YB06_BUCMH|nr:hydroxyacylglutathione hydrolase [Buchnera aphidicola]QCI23258.1 hydroxyacylglutathione hydrolase [Buchnera aphidicola (Melaphis rhois)]
MRIEYIPILKDNYVWIIINDDNLCIIIDPGDYDSIINSIKKLNIYPVAILITHYHQDHIGGVKKLLEIYPNLFIYGPKKNKNFKINKICTNNDYINILNYKFKILSTPGHTSEHISYYTKPHLFCGDVLFSSGCGKIEQGLALKMYRSLNTIMNLPEDTLIYCAHEYTLNNLKFSLSIFLKNKEIFRIYEKVKKKLSENKCSLPSILKIEKKINPFLNLGKSEVKIFTKIHKDLAFKLNILLKLREMKEKYK